MALPLLRKERTKIEKKMNENRVKTGPEAELYENSSVELLDSEENDEIRCYDRSQDENDTSTSCDFVITPDGMLYREHSVQPFMPVSAGMLLEKHSGQQLQAKSAGMLSEKHSGQ